MPFVNPVIVVLVTGGEPVTVTGGCGVEPIYGVTVYEVIGLGPEAPTAHSVAAGTKPTTASLAGEGA